MMDIKVGHRDVYVNSFDPTQADESKMVGYYQDGKIFIDERLDPPEQARVLIHELIHAMVDVWRISSPKFTEETVCRLLDNPLATLFRDNPELLKILDSSLNHNLPVIQH